MTIPIIRRAIWTVAVLAFGYVVFAFWNWRPAELLIAGAVFLLCLPTDLLLHLRLVRQRRSPFGPVDKWGMRPGHTELAARYGITVKRREPWWRRILRHWSIWTTAAGAIIGVALYGSAATAHADPLEDGVYLSQLADDGVPLGDDTATVITVGHGICTMFDRGATFAQVLDMAVRAGFTRTQGAQLIGTAIGVYCDDHRAALFPGQLVTA